MGKTIAYIRASTDKQDLSSTFFSQLLPKGLHEKNLLQIQLKGSNEEKVENFIEINGGLRNEIPVLRPHYRDEGLLKR